jgi:hypothetical protein
MNPILQTPSLTVERPVTADVEHDAPSIRTDAIYVVHTSVVETLGAVRVAGNFAKALGVPVTVVHIRAIPYALPIDEPCGISPVATDEFVGCLRAEAPDVRVRTFLCRDRRTAIPAAFKPHSLIVVGGHQRRFWRTDADFWRRALEVAGHFVVFVDKADHKEKSHA